VTDDASRGSGEGRAGVGPVAVLAFALELAMLVLLFLSGWRLGSGGPAGALLGMLLVVAAGGVWAVWMAPTSSRRLADPGRLIVQLVLFVTVGAVVIAAGWALLGAGFAVLAAAVFTLSRRFA
jgi:Protein of unknown function (DUF2568)